MVRQHHIKHFQVNKNNGKSQLYLSAQECISSLQSSFITNISGSCQDCVFTECASFSQPHYEIEI